MSWRDRYQPGSFRGVEFATVRHELSGGRRVELHEFPGRDEPLAEDLGRRARRFQIECFVWGADYYDARDALLEALEASGPATLIHPWHGTRYVSVDGFSLAESTEDGGMANFQIDFVEAGVAPAQTISADTGAQARSAAADVISDAPTSFAKRFDVSKVADFVDAAAGKLVATASSAAQIAAGLSGGAGGTLRAFDMGLRLLGADGLLHAPLALGHALVGLVSAVSVLGGTHRSRIAALTSVAQFGDGLEMVPGATPARRQQQANQDAIIHIVRATCAAEMVRVVSDIRFNSYEDAIGTRDTLAGQLDQWALQAADAGEDDRAAVFDRLRLAMVRDVTARGGTLARLYAYRLGATEPALVVAQRLYGNTRDLAERTADLIARNSVRHPGFVPGGADIKVLTNG